MCLLLFASPPSDVSFWSLPMLIRPLQFPFRADKFMHAKVQSVKCGTGQSYVLARMHSKCIFRHAAQCICFDMRALVHCSLFLFLARSFRSLSAICCVCDISLEILPFFILFRISQKQEKTRYPIHDAFSVAYEISAFQIM